MAVADLQDICL